MATDYIAAAIRRRARDLAEEFKRKLLENTAFLDCPKCREHMKDLLHETVPQLIDLGVEDGQILGWPVNEVRRLMKLWMLMHGTAKPSEVMANNIETAAEAVTRFGPSTIAIALADYIRNGGNFAVEDKR